jgi:heme-degrading monooxygenase HmoA
VPPRIEEEEAMFGTVARIQAKPGMGPALEAMTGELEATQVDGHLATYVFRLDQGTDDYYLVAVFRDRESYRRNAESPEQHARYLRMRELLAADPKWHDGDVVWSMDRR